MNEILIQTKKNFLEFISALFFLLVFYLKNRLVHDYFSISGIFLPFRFKIAKIEFLARLISLSSADRAILYEYKNEIFIPTAYSLREGIRFDRIDKKEIQTVNELSEANYFTSFFSFDEDNFGILALEYLQGKKTKKDQSLLNQYAEKFKEIYRMEKQESKKIFSVLIQFLYKLTKLITFKNILRFLVMGLNIQLIQYEMKNPNKENLVLPLYGMSLEIPLLLVYFLAALANAGILETIFKLSLLFEKIQKKIKEKK
jgi:hypothetical protein